MFDYSSVPARAVPCRPKGKDFVFLTCNKSFMDQACLVKMELVQISFE